MSRSQPTPPEGVFTVATGDQVSVATNHYEWANPMTVQSVTQVEWVADGENWMTRDLTIRGGYSSDYRIRCVEGQQRIPLRRVGRSIRGYLTQFDPVAERSNSESEESSTEHPTDGDSGGPTDGTRPGGLTEGDIHAVAEHYETLTEVATDLEVGLDRARAILSAHGCLKHVEEAGP